MTLKPLAETEEELTSDYDVTEQQIEAIKDNAETVTTDLFEQCGVEIDDSVVDLVHQRLLSNALLIMHKKDWPPDEDDSITAQTPEDHFQNLCDELNEHGSAAESNISFILGTLTNDVGSDHPIYEYANARLSQKYSNANNRPIPDDVEKWLGGGVGPWSLETRPVEAIEGVEILTGTRGNEMGRDVRKFVVEHTTKNYLITNRDAESEKRWGSMAVPFETRAQAEEFKSLVQENGGSLRLSSGDYGEWFCFEAE